MAEQTVTVGVGALSIEDVIAVARGGAKVAISDESKHEMALSRAVIDHLADDTVPHYGISPDSARSPPPPSPRNSVRSCRKV